MLSPLILLHWVLGFGRWNFFYLDTAREMIMPRRILAGELPFRDFEVFYGPLPYHVTAFFLKLFGNHLWVDRALNVLLLAATVWLLCRVAGELGMSRRWRLVLGGSYLVLFAFPADGFILFSFLWPHCQAGVYQPMLQLLLAWLVVMICKRQRTRHVLGLCLVCGTMPLFSRLDSALGIAFFGLIGLAFPWILFQKRSALFCCAISLAGLAAMVLPGTLWFLVTSAPMPQGLLIERLLEIRYFLSPTSDLFVWKAFFRSACFGLLLLGATILLAKLHRRPVLWLCLASVSALTIWIVTCEMGTLGTQYYFMILVFDYAATAIYLFCLGSCPDKSFFLIRAILGLGGCLFAARVFASAYSFYAFIYAGMLALLIVLVALKEFFSVCLAEREFRRVGWTLGFCWCSGLLLLSWRVLAGYGACDYRVDTEWGPIWMRHSPQARHWKEVAKVVNSQTRADERLYSYCPNAVIYVLSSRLPAEYDVDGTRWKSRVIDGVLCSFAEDRTISLIEKHRVQWIIQDNETFFAPYIRSTRLLYEKGQIKNLCLAFGRDEAPKLARWINEHFEKYRCWGMPLEPGSPRYSIEILKKRPLPQQ